MKRIVVSKVLIQILMNEDRIPMEMRDTLEQQMKAIHNLKLSKFSISLDLARDILGLPFQMDKIFIYLNAVIRQDTDVVAGIEQLWNLEALSRIRGFALIVEPEQMVQLIMPNGNLTSSLHLDVASELVVGVSHLHWMTFETEVFGHVQMPDYSVSEVMDLPDLVKWVEASPWRSVQDQRVPSLEQHYMPRN